MNNIAKQLLTFYKSIKDEPKKVLGLPGNMIFNSNPILPYFSFLLNNVGDPFENSNYKLHTKKFEKEVLKFFAKSYGLKTKNNYWGYITNGGTEGNMHGILTGREKFTDGILYFSKDTHYSIEKIAKILRIDYKIIKSQKNGEIDYKDLKINLEKNKNKPAILNLNIGTTFKGATDSVSEVVKILSIVRINKFYIHCDAALFGGYIPFIVSNSSKYFVNFSLPINSISISGHKFIGSPMPCGIFITRKIEKTINSKINYIGASDTTISGSRNGHTSLFLWYAIKNKGKKGFKKDAKQCLNNVKYLKSKLDKLEINTLLNHNSNILVFDKPKKQICNRWQLSVSGEKSHIVVMPHVTKKLIDDFINDIN